jgi:hypothetical protein
MTLRIKERNVAENKSPMPDHKLRRERVGFFGLRLELAASKAGLTPKQIAQKVGCSYEHIRKLFRCRALPSKWMMKDLCRVLRMDMAEAQQLADIDYCRWKYGPAFWTSQGRRPESDGFYVLSYFLTPADRTMFLHQMQWCIERGEKQKKE